MRRRYARQPETATAVFEAGRDGFWLAHWLRLIGVGCIVIEPASITLDRKAKQRKADQIDARKLLILLCDHASGRAELCIVQTPSPVDEDSRELQRLRTPLALTPAHRRAQFWPAGLVGADENDFENRYIAMPVRR